MAGGQIQTRLTRGIASFIRYKTAIPPKKQPTALPLPFLALAGFQFSPVLARPVRILGMGHMIRQLKGPKEMRSDVTRRARHA
jgi:hypothetical protein